MKGYYIAFVIVYFIILVFVCDGKRGRDKIQDEAKNVRIKYSRNLDDVIDRLCMPRGSNRLVYRLQNKSDIFVGFDDIKHGLVYSMSWKINKDNPGKPRLTMNIAVIFVTSILVLFQKHAM